MILLFASFEVHAEFLVILLERVVACEHCFLGPVGEEPGLDCFLKRFPAARLPERVPVRVPELGFAGHEERRIAHVLDQRRVVLLADVENCREPFADFRWALGPVKKKRRWHVLCGSLQVTSL